MTIEKCLMDFCIELAPIDASAPKFFGFSEFLTSLALMALAWTTTDVRYRFRIECAPIPLKGITFGVVVIVGMLTLLTDLWRAEQWLAPTNTPLTVGSWQAIMGGALLLTFLSWAWFAFIRPATYGKWNAERFTQALCLHIFKGSPEELSIIADEITQSAYNIIQNTTDECWTLNDKETKIKEVQFHANKILSIISDKRMCRAITNSSPMTARIIFQAISETNKYNNEIFVFTKNIISESINNENSFIYHEDNRYESGFTGDQKPLSNSIFSNFDLMERMRGFIQPNSSSEHDWKNKQWKAYLRAVSIILENYRPEEHNKHPQSLTIALEDIRSATSGIYKLNSNPDVSYRNEDIERINLVVGFIGHTVSILNEKKIPNGIKIRVRNKSNPNLPISSIDRSIYDEVAKSMFNIFTDISHVTDSGWKKITEPIIERLLMSFSNPTENRPEQIIQSKFRRLLYNEISSIISDKRPNQPKRPAHVLNLYLAITGIKLIKYKKNTGHAILQKAILAWLKRNYDLIYKSNREIAELCLGKNTVYDNNQHKIIREYTSWSGTGKVYDYLDIDPAEPSLASSSPTPTEH